VTAHETKASRIRRQENDLSWFVPIEFGAGRVPRAIRS